VVVEGGVGEGGGGACTCTCDRGGSAAAEGGRDGPDTSGEVAEILIREERCERFGVGGVTEGKDDGIIRGCGGVSSVDGQ